MSFTNVGFAAVIHPSPPTGLKIGTEPVPPPEPVSPPSPPGNEGLLTGMTPKVYNIPSGWTLIKTQDFENGCPSGESCGLWSGSITTTKNHSPNGSHSIEGTYSGDQAFPGWRLEENQLGSYSELYISWWEWLDVNARFNDEFWMLHLVTPSGREPWEEIVLPWFEGYDENGNMVYNGTKSNLTLVTQGDIDSRFHLKHDNPADGRWIQWEIQIKPKIGVNQGSIVIYKNGSIYASKTTVTLSNSANFSNAQLTIGGQYSMGCWASTANCSTLQDAFQQGKLGDYCSTGPGIGQNIGICFPPEKGYNPGNCGSFNNPRCSPKQPSTSGFKRFFDDIIILKR